MSSPKDVNPIWETLVADTSAYLKLKSFHSSCRNLCSPPSVISEIRDSKSKNHLNFLVEPPNVRQPSEDARKYVKAFASKTGDLKSLSETDIDVIALAVTVAQETGFPLKSEPPMIQFDQIRFQQTWSPSTKQNSQPRTTLATPGEGESKEQVEFESEEHGQSSSDQQVQLELKEHNELSIITPSVNETSENIGRDLSEETCDVTDVSSGVDDPIRDDSLQCCTRSSIVGIEEDYMVTYDEDDGCGEWITEDNYERISAVAEADSTSCTVACVTSDFAIQNVLLQMGIPLVSLDGLRIRKITTWIQYCLTCHRVVLDQNALFCKRCGYHQLVKTALHVTEDGLVARKPARTPNLRGTIYPVPKQSSMKKANFRDTFVYSADQLMDPGFQSRYRQACRSYNQNKLEELDPFHPKSVSDFHRQHTSAPTIKVCFGRANPNSNRWNKTHKRK